MQVGSQTLLLENQEALHQNPTMNEAMHENLNLKHKTQELTTPKTAKSNQTGNKMMKTKIPNNK